MPRAKRSAVKRAVKRRLAAGLGRTRRGAWCCFTERSEAGRPAMPMPRRHASVRVSVFCSAPIQARAGLRSSLTLRPLSSDVATSPPSFLPQRPVPARVVGASMDYDDSFDSLRSRFKPLKSPDIARRALFLSKNQDNQSQHRKPKETARVNRTRVHPDQGGLSQ